MSFFIDDSFENVQSPILSPETAPRTHLFNSFTSAFSPDRDVHQVNGLREDKPGQNNSVQIDHSQLRAVVQDCLNKSLFDTAIFWADKLVALTSHAIDDVFLLSTCYFKSKQYRRAVHLLKRCTQQLEGDDRLRFQHLSAQCLGELNEWEEALAVLGDEEALMLAYHGSADSASIASHEISLWACVAYMRGRIYEGLEHRARALVWYKLALKRDPKCSQAFDRLISGRMLSHGDEVKFVDEEMVFPPELGWLRLVYQAKVQEHDYSAASKVGEKTAALSSEYRLEDSLEMKGIMATHYYNTNDIHSAHDLAKHIIHEDPFNHAVLPVYICTLVNYDMINDSDNDTKK
jgi:anaphase-promoting complex subunit 6